MNLSETRDTNLQGYGSVHAVLGPMWSGKTDELFRLLGRYKMVHIALTYLFKPGKDTREGDGNNIVYSHNGGQRKADAFIQTGKQAWQEITERVKNDRISHPIIVVGIDEAQFVDDLLFFVKKVLDHTTDDCLEMRQKTIILYIACLDGTFEIEPWKEINVVLPRCTSFYKLCAICSCCGVREAPYSRRDTDSKVLVLPGKEGIYTASCIVCFHHKSSCKTGFTPPSTPSIE